MKVKDILKKLGINVDDDVDDTKDTGTNGEKVDDNEKEKDTSDGEVKDKEKEKDTSDEDVKDKAKESDKTDTTAFKLNDEVKNDKDGSNSKEINKQKEGVRMTPKYNVKTGLFELSGIEDEELKAVLKLANDTVKSNNNKVVIDKAVDEKIGSLKLAKGISASLIKKSLDMANVKVGDDGCVVGVNEAFETLKKSESGLFQAENSVSNPMLEGFNPVKGVGGNEANSLAEAIEIEMMQNQ